MLDHYTIGLYKIFKSTNLIKLTMTPLIVYSSKDIAGKNIAQILEDMGFSVHQVKEEPYAIKELPESSGYIVVSKHSSESGTPTFCAHTTGNIGDDNSFGGERNTLGICNANWIKEGILGFKKNGAKFDYSITLETTHHGPTHIAKPLIFIEVGGTEKQWNNEAACAVVANTVMDIINSENSYNSYIGFGGGHYPSKFNKFIMETNNSIGHICPKYKIDYLTEEIVNQMLERTFPKPIGAVLDKKGMTGTQKERIIAILKKIGMSYILL